MDFNDGDGGHPGRCLTLGYNFARPEKLSWDSTAAIIHGVDFWQGREFPLNYRMSVAAKKGTSLAVEKEPPVRLRYGPFEPALSFRNEFVPVSATGRYRRRRPARST